MLMVSSGVGAGIMFIWDYLAYMLATSDASCVELFAGNNLFRNILCFLLKIVTMQVNPSVIYYTAYYSRIGDTLQGPVKELEINFLEEDAATELNCTIASRSSSRKDLFSQRELNS